MCHTIQHRAVLIIFPLNLQTIAITEMLSSGEEEARLDKSCIDKAEGAANITKF